MLFGLTAFLYLYPFPQFPEINNPHENVRFYMTASMVEEGTYAIDTMRERWGWVNHASARNGHLFSVKAPGTSWLGVPGYALYYGWTRLVDAPVDQRSALWWCRLTGSVIPTLAFAWIFLGFLLRRLDNRVISLGTYLAVVLGSPFYAYGMMFVSHSLAGVCAFGAFALLRNAWVRRQAAPHGEGAPLIARNAFWAGLLAAAVTLFEYPGLIMSAGLSLWALFVLRPSRSWWWFVAGAVIPTLLMMHFQWVAYDNPLTPGHRHLDIVGLSAVHTQGLNGATTFHWEALRELILSPTFGLLAGMPLVLLCVLMPPRHRKRWRVPELVALTLCALTAVAIAFVEHWRAGWTVGPRYLVMLLPLLGWCAALSLRRMAHLAPWLGQGLTLGLVAVGLVRSGWASAHYPHLPEQVRNPVAFLTRLVEDGHFPDTLLPWTGWVSAVPWLLALLGAFAYVIARARQDLEATAVVSFISFALLISYGERAPSHVPDATYELVTETWYPPP